MQRPVKRDRGGGHYKERSTTWEVCKYKAQGMGDGVGGKEAD